LVYTTPDGISTLDLATRRAEQVVQGRVRLIEAGRKTQRVYYLKENAVWTTDTESKETAQDSRTAEAWRSLNGECGRNLLAGTYIEGDGADYGGGRGQTQQTRNLDQPRNKGQMMEERWAARLPMALFTVDIRSGEIKTIHRSNDWLNHLLFSPMDPSLLMFCHEGPWHKVDRIWTIRTDGSQLKEDPQPHHGHGDLGPRILERRRKDHLVRPADAAGEDFWLAGYQVETGARTWYHLQRNEWSIHFNVTRDGTLFAGTGAIRGRWPAHPMGSGFIFSGRSLSRTAG